MARTSRAAGVFLAVLVLAGALALGGCKGDEKRPAPSLLDRLPLEDAMIRIDGHEVSGAWVRNWCITEYLTLLRASGGVPMKVDEYSLIQGGMDLLGRMYVIALEAQRRGLVVTEDQVKEQMAKEAARFESTDEWRKRLQKSGLTVEERRAQVRIELLFHAYRNQVAVPLVQVRDANDDQARAYYAKHTELFRVPRRMHLQHLVRSVAKDANEELRARERAAAEKALARINAGEGFDVVAREVSTEASAMKGGDVGWVTEDVPIQAQLKPAVLALQPGGVTRVLESPQGYHVFKLVEAEAARVRTFDEARDEIKGRLLEQGLRIEMERTAAVLRRQLIAEKKYEIIDLVALLGPPPVQAPASAPAAPGAGAVPGAPGAPAGAPPPAAAGNPVS